MGRTNFIRTHSHVHLFNKHLLGTCSALGPEAERTSQSDPLLSWYLVAKWCPTLCDAIDCSMPGFPVLHYLLEFAQTHVHWVGDSIQPSQPLSPPSPPAFNLSQHPNFLSPLKLKSQPSTEVTRSCGTGAANSENSTLRMQRVCLQSCKARLAFQGCQHLSAQ